MTRTAAAGSTAVRVAFFWRAMHVQVDAPPVFEDEIELRLTAPDVG